MRRSIRRGIKAAALIAALYGYAAPASAEYIVMTYCGYSKTWGLRSNDVQVIAAALAMADCNALGVSRQYPGCCHILEELPIAGATYRCLALAIGPNGESGTGIGYDAAEAVSRAATFCARNGVICTARTSCCLKSSPQEQSQCSG